ncbi:hypothetical protein LQ226_07210 [Pontibacillus sp. HN14]|nr:hypothetical protein [Pontibacillus sp. HN14]
MGGDCSNFCRIFRMKRGIKSFGSLFLGIEGSKEGGESNLQKNTLYPEIHLLSWSFFYLLQILANFAIDKVLIE